VFRGHRAELGNRHLVLRQDLEQQRLALDVQPVDLVEQEHDRVVRPDRRQQRPAEQELLAEHPGVAQALRRRAVVQLKLQQLAAIVPLVDRLRLVKALVALQPDQPLACRQRHTLGQLRLAGPGRPLDQDGLAQLGRQVDNGPDGRVGQIPGPAKAREHAVDRAGNPRHISSIQITRRT